MKRSEIELGMALPSNGEQKAQPDSEMEQSEIELGMALPLRVCHRKKQIIQNRTLYYYSLKYKKIKKKTQERTKHNNEKNKQKK